MRKDQKIIPFVKGFPVADRLVFRLIEGLRLKKKAPRSALGACDLVGTAGALFASGYATPGLYLKAVEQYSALFIIVSLGISKD